VKPALLCWKRSRLGSTPRPLERESPTAAVAFFGETIYGNLTYNPCVFPSPRK
jgi:hypothetical protein